MEENLIVPIMSENIIIVLVALAILIAIAVPFIRRARRHKTVMSHEPIVISIDEDKSSEKETYLSRFIYKRRLTFHGKQSIWIRPEYYATLKEISRVIGRNNLSPTAYLDKVLEAHFEEYKEIVETLLEENTREQLAEAVCFRDL